jgi:hypothetical protein
MKMKKLLTICGITAVLVAGAASVSAQTNTINAALGGSSADPAQQRYLKRVYDGLGFTNDADWNAIEPLVQNVFEAQRDLSPGSGMSRVPVTHRIASGTNTVAVAQTLRRVSFGPADPESQALQKALDDNASTDDIKAALAAYHAAQKAKRAKLEAAQENLRNALTPQQEAKATLLKVLD